MIELPGVQDSGGKADFGTHCQPWVASVADENATYDGGVVPAGTESYLHVAWWSALTAETSAYFDTSVQNAQVGRDENGTPEVNITPDTAGGKPMQNATRDAVGKQMAVLFIENKQKVEFSTFHKLETIETRTPYAETKIISQANIQAVLGSSFRITGLLSCWGVWTGVTTSLALTAPMYLLKNAPLPSLGQQNIDDGLFSTQVGYALVFIFMIIFYRLFGMIANIALAFNLIIIIAVLSIMGAALTLPGIAGIVLTIGMAVDANVLIFERIREEISEGARAKSAIVAGFDRAFSSIFDGNITTLLVAIVLFSIGSGPIKGFAITLAIGILSSLFTAIIVTRALVQLAYGNRKSVKKLSIG